ncbi:MAG: hypothetical protein IKE45_10505 [Halomonas sp.]|nr:hypothetical protein [Halomonas sp.]MBR2514430.1 hypothetical protein [Halomonas sp.]
MSYSIEFAQLKIRQFNIKRSQVIADTPSQDILRAADLTKVTNRNARRLIRKAQSKSKGGSQ